MKRKLNKYSAVLIVVFSTVLSNACNENNLEFDPTVPSEITYFTTKDQFREGVLGVYSKLVFFYNYRGNNWLSDIRLLPDDDLTTSGGNPFEIFASIDPANGKVSSYFTFLYHMVNRANAMLEQFESKGALVFTSEDDKILMNNQMGELLFLRAYANFHLWQYFDNPPLKTVRTSEASEQFTGNSKPNELINTAIDDLIEASELLPETWTSASEKGRATKNSANGLLGKAYLFRATVTGSNEDYVNAIEVFDKISGVMLEPLFEDNFKVDKENNQESIFEVQLGKSSSPTNVWLNTDDYLGNGDISGFWGFFDNNKNLFGTPRFIPTAPLVNAFSPDDPRRAHTMNADGTTVTKYVEFSGADNDSGGAAYFNNARVIRFADVKLMKAEALVRSGGSTTEAIALINDVRRRARESVTPAATEPADRSTAETDRTTIMRWIIEERRLELAFEEGHRWADLKRWHMGGILQEVYGTDLSNWDFGSIRTDFDFENRNLYLPIPNSELLLNINVKQNDAWSILE